MSQSDFTRRGALIAGAALPLAVATAGSAAPWPDPVHPPVHRFRLGAFKVTILLCFAAPLARPQRVFGLNVAAGEFAEVSAANGIAADETTFFFAPTLVDTGAALILFDTGLTQEGIVAALSAAGHTPDEIDLVVISHMHGDHLGGLRGAAGETFPRARYLTGAVEFDAWNRSEDAAFEAKVRPLADRISLLNDGDGLVPGVTAMAAFGHTAGHMAFLLESRGRQLLIAGDLASHPVWSLAHPDWEVLWDRDAEMAADTRRRMLGMLAADRIPLVGYHMPFPGVGYVEPDKSGFRYVPAVDPLPVG